MLCHLHQSCRYLLWLEVPQHRAGGFYHRIKGLYDGSGWFHGCQGTNVGRDSEQSVINTPTRHKSQPRSTALQVIHMAVAGIASSLTSGMSSPHPSHKPYVPSSSFAKALSMSVSERDRDLAVAVVLIRSTASVVPSPTRLPNDTFAPASGGAVRCANSAFSSPLRRRRCPRSSDRFIPIHPDSKTYLAQPQIGD